MRLRVRVVAPDGSKQTHNLDVSESDGFDVLQASLESLGVHRDWSRTGFSLNHKDALTGTLGAAGLSSGDLLFLLPAKDNLEAPCAAAIRPITVDNGTNNNSPSPSTQQAPAQTAVSAVGAGAGPRSETFTAAVTAQLAAALAAAEICVAPDGPSPECYRAAAVFACVDAALSAADFLKVSLAWPPRWWDCGHCGFSGTYRQARLPGATCQLRAVSFGAALVVSTMIELDDGAKTSDDERPAAVVLTLQPQQHVRMPAVLYLTMRPPTSLAAATCRVYTQLPELITVVRDRLVTPTTNQLRAAMGFAEQGSFQALSPEIVLNVLRFLDIPSLGCVAQVSRALRDLSASDTLWRRWVPAWARKSTQLKIVVAQDRGTKRIMRLQAALILREQEETRRMLLECSHVPQRPGLVFPGAIGGRYDLEPPVTPFNAPGGDPFGLGTPPSALGPWGPRH